MAAILKVFHAVTLVIDGVPFHFPFGSLVAEIAEKAIADGKHPIVRKVKVPAGEEVAAWLWADTEGFEVMFCQMADGEGYAHVGLRYNAPTSEVEGSEDLTPTGSINQWKDRGMSCVGVCEWDTERAYIHATAATAVGDTGGFPTVWASGSKVLGVADKLAFLNTDEDADVSVWLCVIPK